MIPARLLPMLRGVTPDLFLAGIGVVLWEEPTCTITTGITMASNTISSDVTMNENDGDWNVTMPSNSIAEDVGIGYGNQG